MSLQVNDRSQHAGDLSLECDVAVVGSGAGGAVVATELALAGQRVIVLEEGKHVPAEAHGKMRPSESLRHVWRDAGMTVLLGLGDTPAINLTMGRAVGGSSILTGAVCFRTPGHVLHSWVHEHGLAGLSEEALEPCFREVERAAHIAEVPAAMRSRSTVLFGEGLAKLGHALVPTRRNTLGCQGCGRCNFGCPEQAKMSVDLSYLPRAVEAGATIESRVLVERVEVVGGRAVGVRGRLLNGPQGKPGGRLTVRARRVVLSAGAAHTPKLLRQSGLGRRSGQLGKNLTVHPGYRVFGRFREPVRGWQGALQSAYTDAYLSERVTLMSLFLPPGVLAATTPGVGPEHVARTREIPHLAVFGALIHDDGGGRVWPAPGREPRLTYRMSPRDRVAGARGVKLLAEAFFAAGAEQVYLPVLGLPPMDADGLKSFDLARVPARRVECSSQHPLGSCRMGSAPERSVTDPWGKVWEVDELYVADGSVVPTSLGVNPQQTIMALATRTAWHLRERPLPQHAPARA